jgi:hypothetical protein
MARPFFMPLFTNVLEVEFSEVPLNGVLGSSSINNRKTSSFGGYACPR